MQSVSARLPWSEAAIDLSVSTGQLFLRPLQVLMAAPSLLFLGALTAMLLRHPDVAFYEIDRVAFGLLVVGVVGRGVILRQRLLFVERVTWPIIGLMALALVSVTGQPYDHETWSLLGSKLIVPLALFHLAGLVFTNERHFRQFEIFALIVLAYLSFTAIAFLCGAHSLIFPRFILDSSLGFHASRARGPLLQAVANGVSLNMLGLLALHAYRRGSVRKLKLAVLLGMLPVAILATMTRSVWLSFVGSVIALVLLSKHRSLKKRDLLRVCCGLVLIAGVGLAMVLSSDDLTVYAGGWQMFLERPLTGWGFHQMPAELPRYVSGYHERVLYPHNTYLELLVEDGVLGLVFYLWLMWEMWRLGRAPMPATEESGFLDRRFHRIWPILLAVYWVNSALVVMSYQFVNGLLFTMAGMLAAQKRRAEAC